MEPEQTESNNWKPLESNPEVITKFMDELGFDTSKFQMYDLFNVEEWAQAMVPVPTLAVLFLFPSDNKNQKEAREAENENIKKNGQVLSPDFAENACGTIAVFHAVINIASKDRYRDLVRKDSVFNTFIIETKSLNPEEKGRYFENFKKLEKMHKKAVNEGQTQATETASGHFIAFIEKDGFLYELDGCKEFPVNHGQCTEEDLLSNACLVVKQFMDRDPEEVKFSMITLSKAETEAEGEGEDFD